MPQDLADIYRQAHCSGRHLVFPTLPICEHEDEPIVRYKVVLRGTAPTRTLFDTAGYHVGVELDASTRVLQPGINRREVDLVPGPVKYFDLKGV